MNNGIGDIFDATGINLCIYKRASKAFFFDNFDGDNEEEEEEETDKLRCYNTVNQRGANRISGNLLTLQHFVFVFRQGLAFLSPKRADMEWQT